MTCRSRSISYDGDQIGPIDNAGRLIAELARNGDIPRSLFGTWVVALSTFANGTY